MKKLLYTRPDTLLGVLTLLFMFLFSHSAYSQINLVPNPSFEDTIQCPDAMADITYSIGWNSFNETPDYFHLCSSSPSYSIPNNGWGSQLPASCDAYVGFWAYVSGTPDGREYIGRQLSSPMIIGQKYFVSFKISLAEGSNCATDKVGVLFSTISYSQSNPINVNNSPHIYTSAIVSDTTNWIAFSGFFIADSAYQYIIIGNLFDDSNTDTTILKPPYVIFGYEAYYYLDDICVSSDSITCNPFSLVCNVGIKENNIENTISIFPNPNNGTMTVKYVLAENQKGRFEIYNVVGIKVTDYILQSNTETLSVSQSDLNEGIYFYRLTSNDKVTGYGKVVVIKQQ